MDADGDLDLYASNYVDFTFQNHHIVRFNGHPAYVGPLDYAPTPDTLFRNNGDGTFTDVSQAAGIAAHSGTGMGMVCGDIDHDGDTDIVVGNDMAGNFVFQNDGSGNFEEIGLLTGLAYDVSGKPQGTMGIECGDYDNDGRLDLYATSYQQDLATLYRNQGDGLFEDVTSLTGAGEKTLVHVTWGCGIVDFDNDGYRDLFVACGHLHDNVEKFDTTAAYLATNLVFRNTGTGRFVDVTSQCGDGLQVRLSTRGVAFGDLDLDGDLDVVLLNSRRGPTLLRNDAPSDHHWIQIRLRGTSSSRDAIGSSVKVVAGDLQLIDEVHSGRGYQSHYGTCLHFGLGKHPTVDRIEVHWLGGGVDRLENVPANQRLTITQSAARPVAPAGQ